ncbi:hypothetical protein BKA59DRAFT_461140 [Fusarium tricinctum]|uniref:Ecp2 effector protein domain-containing protein n=1 Tax=Fusarium tricinctum TaxID=61284 RepID=A0A8K0W6Y4_9HYPO|nr:hypothetical protein BKA59DRAFT_461140 [Fusarium tricinctum]
MKLTPQTTFGLLAVAFIGPVTAARQPKAIWQTECWPVKTTRANLGDCSKALSMIENNINFGEVVNGPHDGCEEIFRVGDCGIEICNQRPSGTHLSLGAVLAAAQIQESICRTEDGATGGITALEGFEQKGEEHTYAEVHLATSSLTSKNGPRNRRDLQPGSAPDNTGNTLRLGSTPDTKKTRIEKKRALTRRDEEWVRNTQFVVKEQWANWDSATDGDLTRSVQSTLTGRLHSDWISNLGHTTTRHSAIGRASDSDGHTWTLTFHASAGSDLNSSPIVDRQPIIDSFFTLRNRIGRDHLGPPNIMTASVLNEERNTVIGHLTLMMVGEIPELNTQIEMPNLRGIVIQFTGSII